MIYDMIYDMFPRTQELLPNSMATSPAQVPGSKAQQSSSTGRDKDGINYKKPLIPSKGQTSRSHCQPAAASTPHWKHLRRKPTEAEFTGKGELLYVRVGQSKKKKQKKPPEVIFVVVVATSKAHCVEKPR